MTDSKFRNFCIIIASNPWFDTIIIICIIVNTIILSLKWYDEPTNLPGILETINYVFAGIFTVEAGVKITAYRKKYFSDGWNMFDFVIVIGTFLGILIS
jgi:hypothetical protein